jgi:hypothetical protein
MENDINGNVDPQNDDTPIQDDVATDAPADDDTPDAAALQDKVMELEGSNRQLFERAKKAEGFTKGTDGEWTKREAPKPKAKPGPKPKNEVSGELDYGQKAYLKGEGIEASEFGFVQDHLEKSGLGLDELLGNGYFKADLQVQRDKATVANATPSGTRGAKEAAASEVDYWINKGELPENTVENRQLRQDIVNKRTQLEIDKSKFASNGIIDR